MIIGKTNLLVVGVTADDKRIPVLDNVFIAKDGSTVGSNGRVILLVSPVNESMKEDVPIKDSGIISDGSGIALDSKTVKETIQTMPRDTMFGGLLEHCNIKERADESIEVITTDGHRERKILGRKWPRDYIKYCDIVGEVFKEAEEHDSKQVVLNLKRMLSLLVTINKICADTSGETPVYLEITKEGSIILRATNRKTEQDIMGIMTAYRETEGKWKIQSDWEMSLIPKKTTIKRRLFKKALDTSEKRNYTSHITKTTELSTHEGKIYKKKDTNGEGQQTNSRRAYHRNHRVIGKGVLKYRGKGSTV